jgi:hypothetical protein
VFVCCYEGNWDVVLGKGIGFPGCCRLRQGWTNDSSGQALTILLTEISCSCRRETVTYRTVDGLQMFNLSVVDNNRSVRDLR